MSSPLDGHGSVRVSLRALPVTSGLSSSMAGQLDPLGPGVGVLARGDGFCRDSSARTGPPRFPGRSSRRRAARCARWPRAVSTPLAYLGRRAAADPAGRGIPGSRDDGDAPPGLMVRGRFLGLSCDQPRGSSRTCSSSFIFPHWTISAMTGGASGIHICASAFAPRGTKAKSSAASPRAAERSLAVMSSCISGCTRTSTLVDFSKSSLVRGEKTRRRQCRRVRVADGQVSQR